MCVACVLLIQTVHRGSLWAVGMKDWRVVYLVCTCFCGNQWQHSGLTFYMICNNSCGCHMTLLSSGTSSTKPRQPLEGLCTRKVGRDSLRWECPLLTFAADLSTNQPYWQQTHRIGTCSTFHEKQARPLHKSSDNQKSEATSVMLVL